MSDKPTLLFDVLDALEDALKHCAPDKRKALAKWIMSRKAAFCPCCGGRMIIIERFERGSTPRYHPSPPTPVIRIDT
jgi:hypothetical protein